MSFLWINQQRNAKNLEVPIKEASVLYLMTPIPVFDGELGLSSLWRSGVSLIISDPFLSVNASEPIELCDTGTLMLNG